MSKPIEVLPQVWKIHC